MEDALKWIKEDKKIILIEGISGSGKTTYIKNLKKHIGVDNVSVVVLHGDKFRPSILDNVDQYFLDNKKLLHELLAKIDGDIIIIDGLIHTTEYDLIGVFDLCKEKLLEYYIDILAEIDSVCSLVYVCVPDVDKLINEIIVERNSSRKEWIEGIKSFLMLSDLSKKNGWSGESGIVSLLKYIKECDEYIYENLCLRKKRYLRNF